MPPENIGKDNKQRQHSSLAHANNKNNNNYAVRAVSAMKPIIYDISLDTIYEAYIDCSKHKLNSNSYTKFAFDLETKLTDLWNSVRYGEYTPSHSYCFIVTSPVYREVFAAAFVDRIVHHWIALRIEPLIEERFISHGNVSMNCRKGYDVKSAVDTLNAAIRKVSKDYTEDCYIFKGDFANFFMSIDKALLWEMTDIFVRENYSGTDIDCLLYLLRVTIFHSPQEKCFRRSPNEYWSDLPNRKSLFHTPTHKGMPIGNLTSQLLANFYVSCFDEWITQVKGITNYIRFVDDFVIVLHRKEDILNLLPEIKEYLSEQLLTKLHPDKIYLQHYSHGVAFVGAIIKPGRTYISNRSRSHFYRKIALYNGYAKQGLHKEYVEKFVQSINSYLGLMIHYNSYNIRKKICTEKILPLWGKYLYFVKGYRKAVVKKQYKATYKARALAKTRDGIIYLSDLLLSFLPLYFHYIFVANKIYML